MFYLDVFYVRGQRNVNSRTLRTPYVCITGMCVQTVTKKEVNILRQLLRMIQ